MAVHESNICGQEGSVRKDEEGTVAPGSKFEIEDDLADDAGVLEDAHEDEPAGHEQMLFLLLAANVGQEEKDDHADEEWERDELDVQVSQGVALVGFVVR